MMKILQNVRGVNGFCPSLILALLLGLSACSGGGEGPASSGADDNTPAPASADWSSEFDGASIFSNTSIVVVISGASIETASASHSLAPLSQVSISTEITGNSVQFTPPGGWPLGQNSLSFSIGTSSGDIDDQLSFTVSQNYPTDPGNIALCAPQSFSALDDDIYFSRQAGSGKDIFKISPDGTNLRQLTGGSSREKIRPLKDFDGRLSFASDFDGDLEVYRMDSDGTNLCRITDDYSISSSPALSPDGSKVVYNDNNTIQTANLDGSNPFTVVGGTGNSAPNYCPDAVDQNIVYTALDGSDNRQVWAVSPDGTNNRQVTTGGVGVSTLVRCCQSGGPDPQIIYEREGSIYGNTLDGDAETLLTTGRMADYNEDCTKIVFIRVSDGDGHLWTANANGSNAQQLTFSDDVSHFHPTW